MAETNRAFIFCCACGMQLPSNIELEKHMEELGNHAADNRLRCYQCKVEYPTIDSLRIHSCDRASDEVVCTACGMLCASANDLEDHLKQVHQIVKICQEIQPSADFPKEAYYTTPGGQQLAQVPFNNYADNSPGRNKPHQDGHERYVYYAGQSVASRRRRVSFHPTEQSVDQNGSQTSSCVDEGGANSQNEIHQWCLPRNSSASTEIKELDFQSESKSTEYEQRTYRAKSLQKGFETADITRDSSAEKAIFSSLSLLQLPHRHYRLTEDDTDNLSSKADHGFNSEPESMTQPGIHYSLVAERITVWRRESRRYRQPLNRKLSWSLPPGCNLFSKYEPGESPLDMRTRRECYHVCPHTVYRDLRARQWDCQRCLKKEVRSNSSPSLRSEDQTEDAGEDTGEFTSFRDKSMWETGSPLDGQKMTKLSRSSSSSSLCSRGSGLGNPRPTVDMCWEGTYDPSIGDCWNNCRRIQRSVWIQKKELQEKVARAEQKKANREAGLEGRKQKIHKMVQTGTTCIADGEFRETDASKRAGWNGEVTEGAAVDVLLNKDDTRDSEGTVDRITFRGDIAGDRWRAGSEDHAGHRQEKKSSATEEEDDECSTTSSQELTRDRQNIEKIENLLQDWTIM